MHAAAGLLAIGLGHEGGVIAMLAGHALDDALQQHGEICGAQRIGNVIEVDFVLAGAVFAQRRIGGDLLRPAGERDVVEDVFEIMQFRDRQNLRLAGVPAAFAGVRRTHRIERRAHMVDQVEFQLGGDDRRQLQLGITIEHVGENLARIGEIACAVGVLHRQHDLRRGTVEPGNARQRLGNGIADPVRIARALGQAGGVDIAAPDVEGVDGAGDGHALGEHVERPLARDPLAARHAVDVDHEGFEHFDIGIILQEFLRIGHVVHKAPV